MELRGKQEAELALMSGASKGLQRSRGVTCRAGRAWQTAAECRSVQSMQEVAEPRQGLGSHRADQQGARREVSDMQRQQSHPGWGRGGCLGPGALDPGKQCRRKSMSSNGAWDPREGLALLVKGRAYATRDHCCPCNPITTESGAACQQGLYRKCSHKSRTKQGGPIPAWKTACYLVPSD